MMRSLIVTPTLFGAKFNPVLPAHSFAAGSTYPKCALGYLINRAASFLGLPKRARGYAVIGAPLYSAHEFAVEMHPNIRAHVIDLPLMCRPAAIPRLVIAASINPIEGKFCFWFWAKADIFNKALNAALIAFAKSPAVTYFYTTTAVVVKILVSRAVAAPLGTLEGRILGCFVQPVNGRPCRSGFIPPTAARLRFSFSKAGPCRPGRVPADAPTFPDATVRTARDYFYGREATKGLPCQVLGQIVHSALHLWCDTIRKSVKGLEKYEHCAPHTGSA